MTAVAKPKRPKKPTLEARVAELERLVQSLVREMPELRRGARLADLHLTRYR